MGIIVCKVTNNIEEISLKDKKDCRIDGFSDLLHLDPPTSLDSKHSMDKLQ